MSTRYLTIERKERQTANYIAGLSNFRVTDAEPVNPDIILSDPALSLYCLDPENARAIFAELPPHIDLSKVPFVYQAQFDHVQRFVAVPYETLHSLGRQLPAVGHLILIYTTGRSGSTLLSNAFNQLDSVLSLSELDVITQLVYLRALGEQPDQELRTLIDSLIRLAFKPTLSKHPTVYALKLQSEAIDIMDLLQATFSHAKNLFLYRDAASWIASYYRVLKPSANHASNLPLEGRLDILRSFFASADNETYSIEQLMQLASHLTVSNPQAEQDFARLAPLFDGVTHLSAVQILALWWFLIMDRYVTKASCGIPILPVQYDHLNSQPLEALVEILQYCGLPTTLAAQALDAFGRDSQEGTALARIDARRGNSLQLSRRQKDDIATILKRNPRASTPEWSLLS